MVSARAHGARLRRLALVRARQNYVMPYNSEVEPGLLASVVTCPRKLAPTCREQRKTPEACVPEPGRSRSVIFWSESPRNKIPRGRLSVCVCVCVCVCARARARAQSCCVLCIGAVAHCADKAVVVCQWLCFVVGWVGGPKKRGVGDLESRVFAVVAASCLLSVDVLSRAGRNVMGDGRIASHTCHDLGNMERLALTCTQRPLTGGPSPGP